MDEFDGNAVGVAQIDNFTAGIRPCVTDIGCRYRTNPEFLCRYDSRIIEAMLSIPVILMAVLVMFTFLRLIGACADEESDVGTSAA